MTLLEQWRGYAYNPKLSAADSKKIWDEYFAYEKNIYEQLLENPDEPVTGTVKELSEKYNVPLHIMVGFLDGIDESLKEKNPIESMDENTNVSLCFDKEMLYRNMVYAKATWLYELEGWNRIFDAETRDRLYREGKRLHTVVKTKKIGRNEPCPCGSGRKYKVCHGRTPQLEQELMELLSAKEQD